MLVKDIMSKNIIALKPSDPVTKFISIMEKEHIHEIIVMDNKKLKGIAKFKTVITKGITDPSKQKVKNLMEFKPPVLNPDQKIEEAAEMLFKTGLRALPVVENGSVIGLVSISDILNAVSTKKDFVRTRAEEIMSAAVVLSQDADIGTARVLMREKGISRIPVVDSNGKIIGIVTVHDLLNSVKRPKEKMSWYCMAAEMERIASMPISNIMNRYPPTVRKDESLSDVIKKMHKFKCSGITVVEDGAPIGIVTLKDLLEVYVGSFLQKGVYYHAIGLAGEDEFVVDTIHRMIRDSLQKIASIYNVQFMFAHFKKYKVKGLRAKWSVRIRIMTDKGLFLSKSSAWDSRDAIGDALDRLERVLIKQKKEIKTKLMKDKRLMKSRR